MNNVYEIVTKIGNTISIKKVIIVVIREKNINHLTLEYLNQNNELKNIIKENNCLKEVILSIGDFLVYDGKDLYKLEKDELVSLNNYKTFEIDKIAIEQLKEAAYILNKEIMYFLNKNNHISKRIKKD